MTDAQLIAHNKALLSQLHPWMRLRVTRLPEKFHTRRQWRTRIVTAWRSHQEQVTKVRIGLSGTYFGYHNVTGPAGIPESFAVDLIDDDNPPTAEFPLGRDIERTRDYCRDLLLAASIVELDTLIRWGLDDWNRAAIDRAVANLDWDARLPLGKDPCHLQPHHRSGVSLDKLRSGWRPVAGNGIGALA